MQPANRHNLNRKAPQRSRRVMPVDLSSARLNRRTRSSRRRGVVLILVVAVLGILFVAGAALLTKVTFSARSIDASKIDRENREAVRTIEDTVARRLSEGFLGAGRIPYNMPTTLVMHQPGNPFLPCDEGTECVLSFPTTGEVPGVHPLVDLTEPIETSESTSECELRMVSRLENALDHRPLRRPRVDVSAPLRDDNWLTLNVNRIADQWRGFVVNPAGENEYFNDADGDGIAEALETRIPVNLLPTDLRLALANRLRATNYPGNPNELTLTLKVVPHGSMVNLNASHPYMRRMALGYSHVRYGSEPDNSVLFAGAPYAPEANEWFLRNRGVLVPWNVAPTRLLDNLALELLQPQSLNSSVYSAGLDRAALANPAYRHWWPYDAVVDTAAPGSTWRVLMNPRSPIESYDVTHNVTTISHDDNFMRSWLADASTGEDVIRRMMRKDNNQYGTQGYGASPAFAIDHYPAFLDGTADPRLGRLKISFPYLDYMLSDVLGINGLGDLRNWPRRGPQRLRFTRTVQDAFMIMLRNRPDFNQDGAVTPEDDLQIATQAAMLTANLIDYADADSVMTPVDIVDTNGVPIPGNSGEPLVAYGFERQPFITEVHMSVTGLPPLVANGPKRIEEGTAVFAIELYNPYDTPIDLSAFELADTYAGGTDTNYVDQNNNLLPRMDVTSLSGSIPGAPNLPLDDPTRFVVLCGYGADCPDGTSNNGDKLGDHAIDLFSVISLIRPVDYGGGVVERVVVDRMEMIGPSIRLNPEGIQPLRNFGDVPDPSEVIEVSIQRDTLPDFWRFTVPKATQFWALGEGTPGVVNLPKAVDHSIFPVHVDAANSSSFASAYPTTGSMLLVSRMGHVYDGTPPGPNSVLSPFNQVHPTLVGMTRDASPRPRNILGEFDQIDNGRLPVFDASPLVSPVGPRHHTVSGWSVDSGGTVIPEVPGQTEGLDALPWGQLVFDYFTAVPLIPCRTGGAFWDITCNRDWPAVDRFGVYRGARVHGRLNINTASWRALSSLPMVDVAAFPRGYQAKLAAALGPSANTLGEDLAQAIVAYREARDPWFPQYDAGRYEKDRNPFWDTANEARSATYRPRKGYGFLTVGELLNVSNHDRSEQAVRMDAGALSLTPDNPAASFEHAVARMVALDEWATTRSHVFTIYGMIRGAHYPMPNPSDPDYEAKLASFKEANQKAIRFQSTVDRLPVMFGADRPVRVGSLISGNYADLRSN